jgi:hypothetical protein
MQAKTPATPTTIEKVPAQAPPVSAAPAAIYQALRSQREVLGDQLQSLESKRGELVQSLQQPNVLPADRAGVEKRIADLDQRITTLDKQIAAADADLAHAAAIPGATTQPPQPPRQGPPEEAYALGALFVVVAFLPLSIAFARRIWRRGATVTVKLTSELSDRMAQLEKSVDTVAVEVERIGEGQRFVTQLLAESGQRALGAGAAEPIVVKRRDAVRESRG